MAKTGLHQKASDTSAAVDAFMAQLAHPCKVEVQFLRELILGVDASVQEGIKWNAPSYRTSEYFATTNLRAKRGVGIILHLGAKVRDATVAIDDPERLLTWHSGDRASVNFDDMDQLRARREALAAILKQWLHYI